jgi:hypothetical protein
MPPTTVNAVTGTVTTVVVAGGFAYLELAKVDGTKLGVTLTPHQAHRLANVLVGVAMDLLGPGALLEALLAHAGSLIEDLKRSHPPADPDAGLVDP